MLNPYRELLDLLPDEPLLIGTVQSISDGVALITMPDGGVAQARGEANVGQNVYFRAGAIEAIAPSLTIELIEV